MAIKSENKLAEFLAILAPIAITLFITPSYSSEPVDLPKLFLLLPFGFLLLGLTAHLIINKFKTVNKLPVLIIFLFALQLTLVLVFSGAPFNQQFFGAMGRNTGYLAYIALAMTFLATSAISSLKLIERVSKSLLVAGLLSTGYGLLQYFGHDPIKWNNPYSPIIGFLGNPDFTSAFIGFSSAILIALFFYSKTNNWSRIGIFAYLLLATFTVLKSHAQQGILVLGIDAILICYFFLIKGTKLPKIYTRAFIILSSVIGLVALAGIFKLGPLSNTLYKVSVRQRGFYWHAAVKMMSSHPFFGIGLDSYGDWYFGKRSANAAFHTLATQSNAAHNVYLDIASNGGLILFLIYIALSIFILVRGIKILKKLESFNPYVIGIFVAWIGYQAQSIISINQLGLAIWGWVLGGLIVGYSYLGNNSKFAQNVKPLGNRRVSNGSSNILILSTIMGIFGFALAFPAFQVDHNYRVASTGRDGQKVFNLTSTYPESIGRTLSAAQLFAGSKLYPQALTLARRITKDDPREYNAWMLIAQLTDPKSSEHSTAISEMKKLNPQDKTIK